VNKPSLGRIVHVLVDPADNNGADVAPAVVTRVWSDSMVNVKAFLDSDGADLCQTSVDLYDERPAKNVTRAAWWPPRQEG
jgi:hypothetical protein